MSNGNAKLWLTPLKRPEYKRERFGVFDLETDGLGGDFLIGAYAVEDHPNRVTLFGRIGDFLDTILSPAWSGINWYAHNGGEYDFKYLIAPILDYCESRGIENHIILSGERVIGFRLYGGDLSKAVTLRDSWAIISQPLKKITKSLSPQFQKKDIGLGDGIRFDPTNPEHLEYLEYDVLGLLHSLLKYDEIIFDNYGVHCGWTTPSMALKAWRRTITEPYWRKPRYVEDFCRNGYYGGLTFLTSTNPTPEVVSLDVNSMYPYVMREYGVPDGGGAETLEYDPRYPGFYDVTVRVPKHLHFGVLPFRSPHGVIWGRGTFRTTITSIEYEYARSLGYEMKLHSGIVFDKIAFPHAEFVTRCERLRAEYKGQPTEIAVKLMQNGLYGKYAMKPMQKRYVIARDLPEGDDYCPHIDEHTGEITDHLYYSESEVNEAYMQPHWSAWVTANARLKLYRAVHAIGFENVLCGDTDSLKVKKDAALRAIDAGVLDVDPLRYGAWKLEHEYSLFHAIAPKTYFAVLENGEWDVRAKGVPKRVYKEEAKKFDCTEQEIIDAHYRLLANGDAVEVEFESVNSTLQVVKYDKAFARHATRSYSKLANSAGWVELRGGIVKSREIGT